MKKRFSEEQFIGFLKESDAVMPVASSASSRWRKTTASSSGYCSLEPIRYGASRVLFA